MTRDRATKLLAKFLAVARDPASSESEIEQALRHAQHIMDAYHIAEEPEAEDVYSEVRVPNVGRELWKRNLGLFVANFVGGVVFLRQRGDGGSYRHFWFYGHEPLVDAAFTTFCTLWSAIVDGQLRISTPRERMAYAVGFVQGLYSKLPKHFEAAGAIITRKREMALEYARSKTLFSQSKRSPPMRFGDRDAFERGKADGAREHVSTAARLPQ